MQRSIWLAVALGIGGMMTACGGSNPPPEVDAAVTPDSGGGTDGGVDAFRVDSGPTGDGNDSFAEAEVAVFNTPIDADLSPEGDIDYYSFEGTAGQWIAITTQTAVATTPDAPGVVDTVITLYDESMTQIAENDDSLPRVNTDSGLFTRLPADGTYYVQVQDYNTWDMPQMDRTDFDYSIAIGGLNEDVRTNDTDPNDDAASAQLLTLDEGFGFVTGLATSTTDVDVFSVVIPADTAGPRTSFFLLPAGPTGSGSTGLPQHVWLTTAAEPTVIIARVATEDSTEATPAVPPGDYLLWVDAPAAAGSNDFYFLRAIAGGEDNPAETMDTENNVVTTPEALAAGTSTFILATLGPDDVDHYSFTADTGEQLSVTCGSRTGGSGIVGLRAEVLTEAGTAVTGASATEGAGTDATFQDIVLPGAGTYLLKLSFASQDPEITGNWVRCGVHLAVP